VISDDGKQILHPHTRGARYAFYRCFINRYQLGADRRRADYAGMQHVWRSEVVHVDMSTETFRRDIWPRQRLTDDGVARGILQRCFGVKLELKLTPTQQTGERDALPASFRPHLAVAGDEIVRLGMGRLGGKIGEGCGRGGRRLPNLHAALLDAARARSAALVRGKCGIALHEFDLVDANPKFFGCNLWDRNPQALAEIDLAAK